jgi:hypothetical protein
MDHHTTLKEVYDNKTFHGKKTKAEAYELCKEELENTGKERVYIWFLEEKDGKLREKIVGYRKDSNVPTVPWKGEGYPGEVGNTYTFETNYSIYYPILLSRKIPFTLIELARVSVLDNAKYCCIKNLIEGLDELRIPATEKEELKKLVRPFRRRLASKIPKVFSDSESDSD